MNVAKSEKLRIHAAATVYSVIYLEPVDLYGAVGEPEADGGSSAEPGA